MRKTQWVRNDSIYCVLCCKLHRSEQAINKQMQALLPSWFELGHSWLSGCISTLLHGSNTVRDTLSFESKRVRKEAANDRFEVASWVKKSNCYLIKLEVSQSVVFVTTTSKYYLDPNDNWTDNLLNSNCIFNGFYKHKKQVYITKRWH